MKKSKPKIGKVSLSTNCIGQKHEHTVLKDAQKKDPNSKLSQKPYSSRSCSQPNKKHRNLLDGRRPTIRTQLDFSDLEEVDDGYDEYDPVSPREWANRELIALARRRRKNTGLLHCYACERFMREREISLLILNLMRRRRLRAICLAHDLMAICSKCQERVLKNPNFFHPQMSKRDFKNLIHQFLT